MICYVTSYIKNAWCDEEFLSKATQFLPIEYVIDVAPSGESKADQLIRLFGNLPDEFVILMEHDFFLTHPVNTELLQGIWDYCVTEKVDRFSLQSKNAHMYPHWDETNKTVCGYKIYRTNDKVVFPFSLEASIWRRKFLLANISPGESDARIEIHGSRKVHKLYTKIYALDFEVIQYLDAVRSGRGRVL